MQFTSNMVIVMAQHFLLSAKARTLSIGQIYKAGEDGAFATFCQFRWPSTDGKPVCPACGCPETYTITTRRKFKCRKITAGMTTDSFATGRCTLHSRIRLAGIGRVTGNKGAQGVVFSGLLSC